MDNKLIDNNIKTIAEKLIPYNITLQHINNARNIRQTLHITIFNNKIYLIHGLKGEERHAQIIKQVFTILKKYTIHLHPIQLNRFLICKNARDICKTIYPDGLIIDYLTPGIKVIPAKTILATTTKIANNLYSALRKAKAPS